MDTFIEYQRYQSWSEVDYVRIRAGVGSIDMLLGLLGWKSFYDEEVMPLAVIYLCSMCGLV